MNEAEQERSAYPAGSWRFVKAGERYIYSEGSGKAAMVLVLEDLSDAIHEAFRIRILEDYTHNFSNDTFEVRLARDVSFHWPGKMEFHEIYPRIVTDAESDDEGRKLADALNAAIALRHVSISLPCTLIDRMVDERGAAASGIAEKYGQNYKKALDDIRERWPSPYDDAGSGSFLLRLAREYEEFANAEKALAFLVLAQGVRER
jgi:hypothetical protein